jgi:hypothetical protein
MKQKDKGGRAALSPAALYFHHRPRQHSLRRAAFVSLLRSYAAPRGFSRPIAELDRMVRHNMRSAASLM